MQHGRRDWLSKLFMDTALEPDITHDQDADTTVEAPVLEEAVLEIPTSRTRSEHLRGSLRARALRGRAPRERGEFDQVTIDVRRVARVMAGGRRFNFSLVIVIGDRKGRVGVGLGKGSDTALAIEKATRDARKHLLTVPRTASKSIPHAVRAKYASSRVEIFPSKGRGLIAGSAMRSVLDLAGITDVVAKIHTRSKNKLTIARATIAALEKLS